MAKKTEKFEDLIKQLEDIVDRLEKKDISLDKSLDLFKQGVDLVKICRKRLEKVEREVEILQLKEE